MEKLVDLVAPRCCLGLILKATVLVACFTIVDYTVSNMTRTMAEGNPVLSIAITFLVGAPFGLFVMGIMVVQRRLKERVQYISETDLLTGLPNRGAFFSRAAQKINEERHCAILMIDVDNFKHINDSYGHYAGDVALTQIGRHLRENLHDDDIVGRIGGEEFAVLLDESDIAAVDRITRQICDTIVIDARRVNDACFHPFTVTFSIGGVMALPGQKLIDLMKFADQALYQAKSNGRNRVVFHRVEARMQEQNKAS